MLESGDCISVIASLYLYETYDILRAKGDDIQLSMLGSKIIALEYEVALIDQIVDGASLSSAGQVYFLHLSPNLIIQGVHRGILLAARL